jgi:hypothetical protein
MKNNFESIKYVTIHNFVCGCGEIRRPGDDPVWAEHFEFHERVD